MSKPCLSDQSESWRLARPNRCSRIEDSMPWRSGVSFFLTLFLTACAGSEPRSEGTLNRNQSAKCPERMKLKFEVLETGMKYWCEPETQP